MEDGGAAKAFTTIVPKHSPFSTWHYTPMNLAATSQRISSTQNQNKWSSSLNLERTLNSQTLRITCRTSMNFGHCGQIRITSSGRMLSQPAVSIFPNPSTPKRDLPRTIPTSTANPITMNTTATSVTMLFALVQMSLWIMSGLRRTNGMLNNQIVY